MYPLIEAYLAGDESERTFCAEQGLSRSVFAYWRAKYRREVEPSGGAFVEVPSPGSAAPSAEVSYPNGVRVALYGRVDTRLLFALVSREAA
jgi:hypothetical protein